jgi:alpha-glucoside transport system substrate-binding protein
MKKLSVLVLLCILMATMMGPVSAQDGEDLVFAIGEDDRFNWEDLDAFMDMDFSGEEVFVFGPWLAQDAVLIESVLDYFEFATGADVIHAGSDSFEQQIVIDIEGGSPPNIAIFPQPGLAADMAARGALSPLGEELQNQVIETYAAGESWAALGTYADENGEDQFFAIPYKVDLKSTVWYVPDNFADAGYEVPETMEELIALSDQIVADGSTPWCIGLGSGDATGWPATDWVEDLLLRTQPPDVYDGWVTNEIPFTDERIVAAIDLFGQFAKNDDYVVGGSASVAATDFRDTVEGLFTVPPDCYMHRQASFIASYFPEGIEVGVDADFFYFPAYESKDLGKPVLGAGTLFAITKDSEATRALIDFMLTPLAHEIYMAQGAFLTPLKGVNLELYPTAVVRKQGEILAGADTFRFDGSDLMPGAIGAGSFWTGMVDFVSGASAEEVAQAIQDSWDSIK